MFKKFLIIALVFGVFFAGCEKKDKKAATDDANQTEEVATQTENETPEQAQKSREQQYEEQFGKIKLTDEIVKTTVEKLPVWVEVTTKYANDLAKIRDLGMDEGENFVDKIPGMKKDLEAAGIDPEDYFPVLEKVLQGHMFIKSKEMFIASKAQYEAQRQQIQDQLNAPDLEPAQKAQYQKMLEDFDRQVKMFDQGPPGFKSEEIEMISKQAADIDAILMKMQQQAAAQQAPQGQPVPQGGQPQPGN